MDTVYAGSAMPGVYSNNGLASIPVENITRLRGTWSDLDDLSSAVDWAKQTNPDTSFEFYDNFGLGNNNGLSFTDMAAIGKMLTGGLNAISGIGNMINSINALNLARDQFDYQKGLANTNLANQAKIINNTYDNAAKVSAALMGSSTDSGLANEYAQRARSRYVRDHI